MSLVPQPGQKTVLITGCTPGGIGHSLCLEYQRQGLHVIATARRPEVLDDLAAKGMSIVALDVTDQASIDACEKKVAAITGGRLDMLVNNAGLTHVIPATDISMPDVRQTFETNVFGVMAMVQAFAPQLIAARGLVVNVASLAALTPYCFGSVYCATKGAVVSYSRTLRLELAPFGVRVMVAMVGTVRSNIAGKVHRQLPPGSLYERVRDLFEWRLVYSQNNATVDTDVFSRRFVADSLKPEWNLFCRSVLGLGRPDWFWFGGSVGLMKLGNWVGEWLIDSVCWYMFGMDKLASIVKQEREQKKLQ